MNGRRIPPIFIISISVLTRTFLWEFLVKSQYLAKGFPSLTSVTLGMGELSNVDMYHVWSLVFSNVSWK